MNDTITVSTILASGGDGIVISDGTRHLVIDRQYLSREVNEAAVVGGSFNHVRRMVFGSHWRDMKVAPKTDEWLQGLNVRGEIEEMRMVDDGWCGTGGQPVSPLMWRYGE